VNGLGSVQHCLAGNYKHWCIINIVFLLEPKHSIIPNTLKKTILSQLKQKQPTVTGFNQSKNFAILFVTYKL